MNFMRWAQRPRDNTKQVFSVTTGRPNVDFVIALRCISYVHLKNRSFWVAIHYYSGS